MANHGAIVSKGDFPPRSGYLASIRDVICHCRDLDEHAGDLTIEAWHLFGDGDNVLYEFKLRAGDTVLLSGRAAVVLDASEAVP